MSKSDLVLQTKLIPPQVKGKILRRERLLKLLKENLDKKLILICADAGYGKTTLLAQLCAEFKYPFMFYDLDTSDNDLATFFNYIVAGIQKHIADFGHRTKGILGQTRNIEILVGTFINEFVEHSPHPSPDTSSGQVLPRKGRLAQNSSPLMGEDKGGGEIDRDFYIILDDYHHLQQNKEIGNALDYLLRHLPTNLHLIIASRSTPPLNLAYYYAKQELFNVDKEQLQFNLTEIQLLLKAVYGLNVPDREIERIERHSEGWITAIQLILQKIAATGEDKAKETLNGYVASGEEVFNYFARDVFENQPKDVREFLIKTSITEYLNPKICNYLLNIKLSKKTLSYLETEHIFVSRSRGNFKYHPLFRDFLFKTLQSFHTGNQIRLLHRKAGRYFSKIKDYFNAVNYFLISEDYEKAAKNLEGSYYNLTSTGEYYTFLMLVDRLPRVILDKHPDLLLEKSQILSFLGRWDEALNILVKARAIFQKQKNINGVITTLNQIGFVYLVLMQPRRALLFEKKAYKLLNHRDSILKARILNNLGNVNRALGRYAKAEDILKTALLISRKKKNTEIEIRSLEALARLYSEETDFSTATEVYSILLTKHENKNRPFGFASLCANGAALYIELFDFARAEKLINQAEKFAKVYNDRRTLMYISGIRGKFYLYQNAYSKAIECYERAIELNREPKEKLLNLYAMTDIIYTHVMMNEISRAKRALEKIEKFMSPHIPPPILIDFFLIKAKINLAEKNMHAAERNFYEALTVAEKYGLLYRVMCVLFYLSQFYMDANNERRAKYHLRKCLDIAEKKGYDFFLVNELQKKLKVFEYALNKNIKRNYLLTILETVETPEAQRLLKEMSVEKLEHDLEINFFGHLVIKDRNGKTLSPKWKTRKAKSLFAYLAVNQDKHILKDRIIETFWLNKGRREAIHSLHDHISFVRKVLQKIVKKEYLPKNIIIHRNQFYTLNKDLHLKIDTREFDELVKKADVFKKTNKAKAVIFYKMALDVYKDDFCPELYDEWVDEQRKYYCAEVLRISKTMAEYYYANKAYNKSLDLYRRALKFDQCDETLHRGIMRCLDALGDKSGVNRQYQVLEKALKKHMNTSPSPETVKVYEEILQHLT
jgi:LuxR family maltose regulon positive regulatory protein